MVLVLLNSLRCYMSTLCLIHYALLLTLTCWKSNTTNVRLMAFAISLTLDPTFGIHFHKTLDTAQPCHLLKPDWKHSSSYSISTPTNISIPSFCYSHSLCVYMCVCFVSVQVCLSVSCACQSVCVHVCVYVHACMRVCVCAYTSMSWMYKWTEFIAFFSVFFPPQIIPALFSSDSDLTQANNQWKLHDFITNKTGARGKPSLRPAHNASHLLPREDTSSTKKIAYFSSRH